MIELASARRVYLSLASRWELSGTEALVLLGEPGAGEAERGERLCLLVRVMRLVQLVHTEPERARAVLREPQPGLENTAPLALMLAEGCAGMARVRDALVVQAKLPHIGR